MRAFLHLIKVPVLAMTIALLCSYAWVKTRGVTVAREARAKAEAAAKEADARAAHVQQAMAEMTKRELGPPLPTIDGWSVSEVESTHGAATYKDKQTGWGVWPKFKAHFNNGVVDQVEALELR